MLVDISHVSDKTFYDALEVSKAPLIASHSSSRALDAHPRNMTDEMIKALAAKGGVIQINYERSYLSQEYNDAFKKNAGDISRMEEKYKKECGDNMDCELKMQTQFVKQLVAEGKLPHVSWERIIDHIDHAVKLVGADHVGLGSDFDGAEYARRHGGLPPSSQKSPKRCCAKAIPSPTSARFSARTRCASWSKPKK